MSRTCYVIAFLTMCLHARAFAAAADAPPNVIIILTDDQGYNDVGCYGSQKIKTPRLDCMAAEGMRFTDWYAPAPVCTPTRAGLLTGCYPQRIGLSLIPREKPDASPGHVLYGRSQHGLAQEEITIAELLKAHGYVTGLVGKWHLGDAPQFLPTKQGFDHYFGIPYSNDMKPPVLMRGDQIIEEPVQQESLLERYTTEATKFIEEQSTKKKQFFLYFAHNAPHTPLIIDDKFKGKSARGLFGDMIEAIDWSVGEILDTLNRLRLSESTLVIFTSDNGPWLHRGEQGGSAFPLRAGKGTTYEGGMRVPCIARWPGKIPAGKTSAAMLSHLDLMPTIARLAGTQPPTDRIIDGKDVSPILLGQADAKSPHEAFFYYSNGNLNAVRSGKWKLKLPTALQDETEYGRYENPNTVIPAALYDLESDISEQKNLLAEYPDVAMRFQQLASAARQDLGDHRRKITGKGVRPIGRTDDLRVMTFNIRVSEADDGDNAWPQRRELLFRTIEKFGPDLLGLQEVSTLQADELTKRLKPYDLITAMPPAESNPSAIMVRRNRFRVDKSGMFWLSPTPRTKGKGWDAHHPRLVTWTKLHHLRGDSESPLVFINTHFDHRGEEARRESAKLLRARLAEIAGDLPVIITGDFNCSDGSEPHAAMISDSSTPRLLDSFRTLRREQAPDDFTFHAFTGKHEWPSRLDWILHTPQFTTSVCEIDRTSENGRYPSDHFPVIAILSPKRQE